MAIDNFSFDKGINTRRPGTLLEDGEMQSCSGFAFNQEGYLKPMPPRAAIAHTALGEIRNIFKFGNKQYVKEGTNIQYKWDLRDYCGLYTAPDENYTLIGLHNAARAKIAAYKDWVFFVNGHENKVVSKGRVYDWGIPNPPQAPAGAAGAAGSPNGTYTIYYTFVVKFPNGEVYETAPSPPTTVSVSNQKISWSGIGTSFYSGTGCIVVRNLYRYSSSLGAIYYVDTINDNTTTTYTDEFADGGIDSNDILSTEGYDVPVDGFVDIETYLQRIFTVRGIALYWSEPYLPFAFKTDSAINVSDSGDDLTGVVYWGDQLYIPSHAKWYRLYGTDPDTWGIKVTYADNGVKNTHTIKRTKYGILGLNPDGVYLFDGSTSTNITRKKLDDSLFSGISDIDACFAEFDGTRYYLYYPTSGSTISGCLVMDFTNYPDIRFYNDPFIATAHYYDTVNKRRFLARND